MKLYQIVKSFLTTSELNFFGECYKPLVIRYTPFPREGVGLLLITPPPPLSLFNSLFFILIFPYFKRNCSRWIIRLETEYIPKKILVLQFHCVIWFDIDLRPMTCTSLVLIFRLPHEVSRKHFGYLYQTSDIDTYVYIIVYVYIL